MRGAVTSTLLRQEFTAATTPRRTVFLFVVSRTKTLITLINFRFHWTYRYDIRH